ncbi:MAG TPA: hypothetical protein DDX68_01260, partial [Clostridium sp.]|nr:hypothetical protein [Clostridium sp.]
DEFENIESQESPSLLSSTIVSIIEDCMDYMVYVWMKDGDNFWLIPRSSTQRTVSGYRWNQNAVWYNEEIYYNDIYSVTCVS